MEVEILIFENKAKTLIKKLLFPVMPNKHSRRKTRAGCYSLWHNSSKCIPCLKVPGLKAWWRPIIGFPQGWTFTARAAPMCVCILPAAQAMLNNLGACEQGTGGGTANLHSTAHLKWWGYALQRVVSGWCIERHGGGVTHVQVLGDISSGIRIWNSARRPLTITPYETLHSFWPMEEGPCTHH